MMHSVNFTSKVSIFMPIISIVSPQSDPKYMISYRNLIFVVPAGGQLFVRRRGDQLTTAGKPSTRFPAEELVEQRQTITLVSSNVVFDYVHIISSLQMSFERIFELFKI